MNLKTLSKYLAILSVTVMVVVSLLMILNFVQIKLHNPISGNTIDLLMQKLDDSPEDQALREQIRAIDLMARKAYFTSVNQLETGAWLLLGFGILLIASVRVYTKKETIDAVQVEKKPDYWSSKSKERKGLILSIGSLAAVALLISLASNPYYTDFKTLLPGDETAITSADVPRSTTTYTDSVESERPAENPDSTLTTTINATDGQAAPTGTNTTAASPVSAPDFPTEAEFRQNHPGFRGPFGLGVSYRTNLPTSWDGPSGTNIIWKKRLSLPGMNSPVVWGNNLYLAGANATVRKVFCYNRLNGNLNWSKEIRKLPGSPANAPKVTNDAGYSASSLTTDGKRVYAIFATGDLICLTSSGEEVWAKNLGVPTNHYGYSSSLLLYKDKLIVQYDDSKACLLLALNTQTGAEAWRTKREGGISWASPILTPKGEIIVNNLPYVAAFNAETGKLKWKTDCLSGEIGSSPAYGNGMVFAANEYAKMVGIKNGTVVWEGYDYLPDVSSPVAYKNVVFFSTSYGDLVCINQQDGSVIWHHEFDNGFYGSPVVADGKLYNIDRAGATVVVEAGNVFKLISQSELGEKSDCTPAFADGRIYIRGIENLYCIGKK